MPRPHSSKQTIKHSRDSPPGKKPTPSRCPDREPWSKHNRREVTGLTASSSILNQTPVERKQNRRAPRGPPRASHHSRADWVVYCFSRVRRAKKRARPPPAANPGWGRRGVPVAVSGPVAATGPLLVGQPVLPVLSRFDSKPGGARVPTTAPRSPPAASGTGVAELLRWQPGRIDPGHEP